MIVKRLNELLTCETIEMFKKHLTIFWPIQPLEIVQIRWLMWLKNQEQLAAHERQLQVFFCGRRFFPGWMAFGFEGLETFKVRKWGENCGFGPGNSKSLSPKGFKKDECLFLDFPSQKDLTARNSWKLGLLPSRGKLGSSLPNLQLIQVLLLFFLGSRVMSWPVNLPPCKVPPWEIKALIRPY